MGASIKKGFQFFKRDGIMELEYKVKKEDLEKCFKFAVQYHLDERKTSASRTTGQSS